MGFVLTPEEAAALIARDPRNRDLVLPYLNGEDLNSRPDQSPSRWVINFKTWPLRRGAPGRWKGAEREKVRLWLQAGVVPDDYPEPVAADYPECLAIVEKKVKPERSKLAGGDATARDRARRWWRFARPTMKVYAAVASLDRLLVTARVSKYLAFSYAATNLVLNEMTVVFADAEEWLFGLLQSSVHESWALHHQSSLETRGRYTPSDCFETFPLPVKPDDGPLPDLARRYYRARQQLMIETNQSLTMVYNRVHDRTENSERAAGLRSLQVSLDAAVVTAYGWADLDLAHGFCQTKQGSRFTISDKARRELLERLLQLNHERYADEARRGLHDRKGYRGIVDSDDDSE